MKNLGFLLWGSRFYTRGGIGGLWWILSWAKNSNWAEFFLAGLHFSRALPKWMNFTEIRPIRAESQILVQTYCTCPNKLNWSHKY
jgi:hypothetical protein